MRLYGTLLDQATLVPAFSLSQVKQQFRKVPVLAFRIPTDPLNEIPRAVLVSLGFLDNVLSNESDQAKLDYLRGRQYIILNFVSKDGQWIPDFYPISAESYAGAAYSEISFAQLQAGNPTLHREVIASGMFESAAQVELIAIQKAEVTEMVSTASLGYQNENALHVIGGLKNPDDIQTKPAGAAGYISLNSRGGVFLINSEDNGNPAGYLPARV